MSKEAPGEWVTGPAFREVSAHLLEAQDLVRKWRRAAQAAERARREVEAERDRLRAENEVLRDHTDEGRDVDVSDEVDVNDEKFATVRRWIGVYYEDGRGDEAFEALDHLETSLREAEAERDQLRRALSRARSLFEALEFNGVPGAVVFEIVFEKELMLAVLAEGGKTRPSRASEGD